MKRGGSYRPASHHIQTESGRAARAARVLVKRCSVESVHWKESPCLGIRLKLALTISGVLLENVTGDARVEPSQTGDKKHRGQASASVGAQRTCSRQASKQASNTQTHNTRLAVPCPALPCLYCPLQVHLTAHITSLAWSAESVNGITADATPPFFFFFLSLPSPWAFLSDRAYRPTMDRSLCFGRVQTVFAVHTP